MIMRSRSSDAAVARAGRPIDETFFCVIAPGWLDHFIYNEYYKTDEELLYACADAMREEYRQVADAGFVLQVDDAVLERARSVAVGLARSLRPRDGPPQIVKGPLLIFQALAKAAGMKYISAISTIHKL